MLWDAGGETGDEEQRCWEEDARGKKIRKDRHDKKTKSGRWNGVFSCIEKVEIDLRVYVRS